MADLPKGVYMKATGIVRRIDELGRVVIPKEIRRTLRIKDGDSLEIFIDREELMLKKYSPMQSLEKFAGGSVKSLHELSGFTAVICDSNEVLFADGKLKKEVHGKKITMQCEKLLQDRKTYLANVVDGGDILPLLDGVESAITAQFVVPIVANSDCLGAVLLLSNEKDLKIEYNAINLARLTADILASQFD